MYTFNRNNRECIHKLTPDAAFYDFTEVEDFYLTSNKLNISHIKQNDMVKFLLYDDRIKDTKQVQKVYGFIMHIENVKDCTFMVCRHWDESGNIFYLDYVYSAFRHTFVRLNKHGSFSDWNQLTHVAGAHAPRGFVEYWMQEHVTADRTEECPGDEVYTTVHPAPRTSFRPGCDYQYSCASQLDDHIYYK